MKKQNAPIGLLTCTSLVVGNMIASGIFMLPAALARFGSISLFGWVGSSIGALSLALMFARLSKRFKGITGGPYAYTLEGLGEFASFLVAWAYWIANCVTGAAITTTLISYVTVFIPELKTSPPLAFVLGLTVIWVLASINLSGVRQAGKVQLVTTVVKISPLLAVSVVGVFYVDASNFFPLNNTDMSDWSVITTTATMTLFAFVGLESATVPAKDVKDPEITIARATLLGLGITTLIYVLGSVVVMGMIPSETLAGSSAPFADAAHLLWGTTGRYTVAIGAIVSTFGALNGWILLQGQIPYAAASRGVFPRIFARLNKHNVPFVGIVISGLAISSLLMLNFVSSLTDTFTFFVLLSTMMVLIPYLFSAASYAVVALDDPRGKFNLSALVVSGVAFSYALWAVAGSGAEAVYWGFIGLLAGVPLYAWVKRKRTNSLY